MFPLRKKRYLCSKEETMNAKEVKPLLEEYTKKTKTPTTAEVLSELRFEYLKTIEVYGARAEKYPKESAQYKKELNKMLSRLYKLTRAGEIIKKSLGMGEQTQLTWKD